MRLRTQNYTFPVGFANMYMLKEAIYVGNPKHKPKPCVIIHVHDDDNDATLADVSFATTCSTTKELSQGSGTVEMIMASLKLTIARHPNIEKVVLVDESHIPMQNGVNIEITARRLLTGRKGWYEELLGAKPYGQEDIKLLDKIRDRNITVQDNDDPYFWNTTNTNRIAVKLLGRSIVGTNWYIPRSVIEKYPVSIELLLRGGGMKTFHQFAHKRTRPHALG